MAFVVFLGGFFLMEASTYRVLGLKPADVMKNMRENMKGMRG